MIKPFDNNSWICNIFIIKYIIFSSNMFRNKFDPQNLGSFEARYIQLFEIVFRNNIWSDSRAEGRSEAYE